MGSSFTVPARHSFHRDLCIQLDKRCLGSDAVGSVELWLRSRSASDPSSNAEELARTAMVRVDRSAIFANEERRTDTQMSLRTRSRFAFVLLFIGSF